jgi:predicted secreted protein
MKLTSIIAIYALFWVMSAFMCLPFGVKTHDEAGIPKVPGQADSAPADFNPKLVAKRATVVSALLFGLYYANYVNGWIGTNQLDIGRLIGL